MYLVHRFLHRLSLADKEARLSVAAVHAGACDDQIAYSSVYLNIQEVARETAVEKETAGQEIARRFRENWEDVKDGATRFGINFVSDLPVILVWVVFLGIVAVVIVIIVKGAPKRKAKRERRKALKLQKKYQKEQAKLAAEGKKE